MGQLPSAGAGRLQTTDDPTGRKTDALLAALVSISADSRRTANALEDSQNGAPLTIEGAA